MPALIDSPIRDILSPTLYNPLKIKWSSIFMVELFYINTPPPPPIKETCKQVELLASCSPHGLVVSIPIGYASFYYFFMKTIQLVGFS